MDNQTATCTVNVKDGIRINDIIWAKTNVSTPDAFATKPEELGKLFQWNRKISWSATDTIRTNWNSSIPYGSDAWAKGNDPSPAGWHIPTSAEIKKLLDKAKVDNEWTTQNGVNGRKFTDKASQKSIFLPAAGYRDKDGEIHDTGE